MVNAKYIPDSQIRYHGTMYIVSSVLLVVAALIAFYFGVRIGNSLPVALFVMVIVGSFLLRMAYTQAVHFREGILNRGLRRKIVFDGHQLIFEKPGAETKVVVPSDCCRYFSFSQTIVLKDGRQFSFRLTPPPRFSYTDASFAHDIFRIWWPDFDVKKLEGEVKKRQRKERIARHILGMSGTFVPFLILYFSTATSIEFDLLYVWWISAICLWLPFSMIIDYHWERSLENRVVVELPTLEVEGDVGICMGSSPV